MLTVATKLSVPPMLKAPTVNIILVVVALLLVGLGTVYTAENQDAFADSPGNMPQAMRQAWKDLEYITEKPHPINSVQNEVVRDYVLGQMKQVAKQAPDVVVVDDMESQVDILDILIRGTTIPLLTFEGSNILVKIPGTGAGTDSTILLSAHFDSVSVSDGATDDGVGVAVVMALVRYFALHRPKNDIVVNINNGEEDGLFGARVFAGHPLALNVSAFVNLDGAGAGGKSLMFRSSNYQTARDYFKHNRDPYAFALSADSFKSGQVRSQTDFVVYEKMNDRFIPGIDIAFFAPRAYYHTRSDSIRQVSPYSLQHMYKNAENSLRNLANDDIKRDAKAPATYFAVLGYYIFMRQSRMLLFNLAMLIVCPWLLGAGAIARLTAKGKAMVGRVGITMIPVVLSMVISFILTLIIGTVAPYILYAHGALFLTFLLVSQFLVLHLGLRLCVAALGIKGLVLFDAERVLTWYISIFWYLVLFSMSIVGRAKNLVSIYPFTIAYAAVWFAAMVSLLEPGVDMVAATQEVPSEPSERSPLLNAEHEEADDDTNGPIGTPAEENDEPDEIGLLAQGPPRKALEWPVYRVFVGFFWLIRFIVMVPLPMALFLDNAYFIARRAVPQTIADGSDPLQGALFVGVFAMLAFVNLAPFLLRVPLTRVFPMLVILLVVIILSMTMISPFSSSIPLKIFFEQKISISADGVSNVVSLYGLPKFIKALTDFVPSSHHTALCDDEKYLSRLTACHYNGLDPNYAVPPESLVNVSASESDGFVHLSVSAPQSKGCELKFSSMVQLEAGAYSGELDRVMMWHRAFDVPFNVTFGKQENTDVDVTCLFDENGAGELTAYNEAVNYLPDWARLTKLSSGLLKVSTSLSV